MKRDSWGGLICRGIKDETEIGDGGSNGVSREGWGGGRFAIIAGACLALEGVGGCARTPPPEPIVKTVEVKTPVPVPCKADVRVTQSYADDAAEFMTDIYDQARALLIGRAQRKADVERLTGAVVGCGGSVK